MFSKSLSMEVSMLLIRKSQERGAADHGWLQARHSFSFGAYRDPRFMGFGTLRVINEDRIAPGTGFATHSHQDMEILTFIVSGALEHKDSQSGAGIIRPGDVQRMSAGTGISHSEFNASKSEPVHLLQIWIVPERAGLTPSYEQKSFPNQANAWQLVAARNGREGALTIHQDVDVFAISLAQGHSAQFAPRAGRKQWVQITQGAGSLLGHEIAAGDGMALEQEPALGLTAHGEGVSALMFDMAA